MQPRGVTTPQSPLPLCKHASLLSNRRSSYRFGKLAPAGGHHKAQLLIPGSWRLSPPRDRVTGALCDPAASKDAEATDHRGVGALPQPIFIYSQALVHFASDGIKINLVAARFEYVGPLLEPDRHYFFDSAKDFHFAFRRKRMALGVYDPEVALQGQVLIGLLDNGNWKTDVRQSLRPCYS